VHYANKSHSGFEKEYVLIEEQYKEKEALKKIYVNLEDYVHPSY
jgi:hypothetical protein